MFEGFVTGSIPTEKSLDDRSKLDKRGWHCNRTFSSDGSSPRREPQRLGPKAVKIMQHHGAMAFCGRWEVDTKKANALLCH